MDLLFYNLQRLMCCKTQTIKRPSSTHSGGARGVVVIVVGNGHGDTSSNPGRD